jgi:hypothetical protein
MTLRDALKNVPSLSVPRSLRTYLVLFATALAVPLLIPAAVSLNRMAALERDQLELRIQLVSNDLTRMVDRELDHTIAVGAAPWVRRAFWGLLWHSRTSSWVSGMVA